MTTLPTSDPRKSLAGSLYAIIDLEVTDAPIDLAERALAAGCSWLQLRTKKADDRTWLEIARALRTRGGGAAASGSGPDHRRLSRRRWPTTHTRT